jgi:hypothetical protein
VAWTVEVTEHFERWWDRLSDDERVSIDGMIQVLEAHGPSSPYSHDIEQSRHPQLKQLWVPHNSRQICVLYVSDDWRTTLILLTGSTAGAEGAICPPATIESADLIYTEYLAKRSN